MSGAGIPASAVEAAAKAAFGSAWRGCSWDGPNGTTEETRERFRRESRAALGAAAPYIAAAALREAAEQLEYGNPVGEFLEERAAELDPSGLTGDEE